LNPWFAVPEPIVPVAKIPAPPPEPPVFPLDTGGESNAPPAPPPIEVMVLKTELKPLFFMVKVVAFPPPAPIVTV
jgi:hypothetical protein